MVAWTWCVELIVLGLAMPRTAAADGSSASSITSLAGLSPAFIGNVVVSTFQSTLSIGKRRLLVMQGLPDVAQANSPLVCGGVPAIMSHTPNIGSNGECFKASSLPTLKSNLSCTCLTYLNNTPSEWIFRFKKPASTAEMALPPSQDIDGILEFDSSLIFGVSTSVNSLKLIGVGDSPVPLELRTSPIPGTVSNDIALIISAEKSTIQSVYVENVDLSSYDIKHDFVPSKLVNFTMKNCNLATFSSDLLADLPKLETLDLSNNSLTGVYQDITKDTCVANYCPIKSMNLSHNRIKTLPTYLLNMDNLQTLSLTQNPIMNYSIDSTVYVALKQLKRLELDPVQTCLVGNLTQVASAGVCVYTVTSGRHPDSDEHKSSGSSYLMYGIIGGCLVVAVLVFVLVKRNSCRSTDDDSIKEPLDAYFDDTLNYDDTHPTISASLLNDPIIITHRIPYNDIRVANCISKGGFGLVYSGVYNRRRVAIKKIRPDRAGDIKQIETFLKEICLMATLNHPRIVEFIGVSWDSLRNLCAVTEFMDRGDLREVLHGFKLRNTPLTWESHKTMIALHIAEGLTYLHSLSPKVIHRDLKSKNVLLNNEMQAKLSDFGISRERRIEETHMTAGIGTSFWIAPEVLLGKDYDERADIFSFGVVLSEIDTDDYPYWNASNPNVGNKAQENMILQMVASGAMRPSFTEACPKAILDLADACLQVEPDDRPTAAEVAYQLQQILQFLRPVSARSTGTVYC